MVEALRLIPGHRHLVFEEGLQSAWLYETLSPHVEEIVVGVTRSRGPKSDLLQESRKHRIVRILETAPGFGPIRSARPVPIVVTRQRFRTKRQFWSYCGLGIVMRSSSDWVQGSDGGWIRAQVPRTRGLSRKSNRVLKALFKGAATSDEPNTSLDAAISWRLLGSSRVNREPRSPPGGEGSARAATPRTSYTLVASGRLACGGRR